MMDNEGDQIIADAIATLTPTDPHWTQEASDAIANEPIAGTAVKIARGTEGGGAVTEYVGWCPECGPLAECDSDGCCSSCGNGCTGSGADAAIAALKGRDNLRYQRQRLVESLGEKLDDIKGRLLSVVTIHYELGRLVEGAMCVANKDDPGMWYCSRCRTHVDGHDVTYHETHVGCGGECT